LRDTRAEISSILERHRSSEGSKLALRYCIIKSPSCNRILIQIIM